MIVKINVNGTDREVKEGGTLLNIFQNLGIFVPHLCYLKDCAPTGRCGLCVVELSDDQIALSCLTQAKAGMIIKTESTRLSEIRQKNINNILKNHKINCFNCKKSGSCNLQSYASKIYSGCEVNDNFHGSDQKSDINNITKDLDQDISKCIYCQRCNKFLSNICDKTNSKIESIRELPESEDLTLNTLDLCPTAALLDNVSKTIKSYSICEEIQTYDVSDVFTPKILVSHQDNEFIKVSGLNENLIKNETRSVCKKLNSRTKIEFNYEDIIAKLANEINDKLLEKKLFIIGSDIDLVTFSYIKYLNDHIKNICVSIDDCNIPHDLPFNIGLENVDLSSMDFAIFLGGHRSSDQHHILSKSLNIKHYESLEFDNLSYFIDNSDNCGYNSPHLFLFSDIFNKFEDTIIMKNIKKFIEEFKLKFGRTLKINVIPSNLSHMFVKDISDYKSTCRLTKELNKNDLEFICVVGDIENSLQQYKGVDIICNSVFPKENAKNIPAKHFLEDSACYLNIFRKIVKTKKIVDSSVKSNREFMFDIMKAVFGDDFYDINMLIHQSIRDKYFS